MEQCDVNKTSNEAVQDKYSTVSWTMILIVGPLVTAFGVVSNLAFILVVYRVKTMRTITNIFLVNLAIADSLLLIIAFAQYIISYVNSPVFDLGFSFNNVLGCVSPNFLIYLCYYTSLWTVTLVSIERYFGVCHLLYHRSMRSTRRTMHLVLASWLISALLASPTTPRVIVQKVCVISAEDGEIIERIQNCVWNCKSCTIVLYATDLIQFLIALIVNIVLYSLIVRKIVKTACPNEDIELRNYKVVVHSRRCSSVAKMLIVNGIVFFICLTPFSVNNVDSLGNYFGWFKSSGVMQTTVAWIGRVLFLLNSTLNPLIYNATNPRYRLAFKQTFLTCRYSRQSSAFSTGSCVTPQGPSTTKTSYM